jgi:hypothetical protein
MTRNVICYVVNNTGLQFYTDATQNDVWNGHTITAPQPIATDTSKQTVFSYEKTTGSMVGVTGKVFYELDNGTFLQISFNNPYNQVQPDGTSENYCDCFFYAGIIGGSETAYSSCYVDCVVQTDGNNWDPANTDEVKNLTATITIYNTNS